MSGVESYVTEAPPHRPRWFGDVGIVAAAVLIVAAIASTLSWCDFSLQSYRLGAGVPVLLCPGGASAGDIPAGTTVRVTAVYSGSLGEFRELSASGTQGWAVAADIDAATGVTTRDIFGLPSVSDPAFDGPDCTSTAPTTVVTTETTETTAVETTAVETTTAGANTTAATTVGRTTSPRPTIRPTATTRPTPTTATTLPTTTTTDDTEGPDVGPVRLKPSTITEEVVGVGCGVRLGDDDRAADRDRE